MECLRHQGSSEWHISRIFFIAGYLVHNWLCIFDQNNCPRNFLIKWWVVVIELKQRYMKLLNMVTIYKVIVIQLVGNQMVILPKIIQMRILMVNIMLNPERYILNTSQTPHI